MVLINVLIFSKQTFWWM